MKKRTIDKSLTSALIIFISIVTIILNREGISFSSAFREFTDPVIETEKSEVTGNLDIFFLDVGQADSILIRNNDKNMLIDAGNNADGKKLVSYFKTLGVDSFEYVIGTHAHEDHIGGMDDIIESFDINTFYMPDVITTTKTFEEVLDALTLKGNAFETPEINSTFTMGDCTFEVLHVGTDAKELNNSSIVLLLKFGKHKYLFTGDAEDKVEESILNKNIQSDVLKVGHHGSEYSTTDDFLEKVNPKYAIIQVGKENNYGHPTDIILNKLKAKNIKIFRTDLDGTIHLVSDGENLKFEKLNTDTNG